MECYCCETNESREMHKGKLSNCWIHNNDNDDNVLCKRCYTNLRRNKGLLIKSEKKCAYCDSTQTYIPPNKPNNPAWFFIDQKGNRFCKQCYDEQIYNEIKAKRMREHSPKRYSFLSKRIKTEENPRTGYCSKCKHNIHDHSCRYTQMHHKYGYFIIFTWFGLEELCISCHLKTRKGEKRKSRGLKLRDQHLFPSE